MQHPLFFIGILPDPSIQQEVTSYKSEIADLFGAKHSLKSPPHITLQAPFRWSLEQITELKKALSSFAEKQVPFEVELKNFDCFPPRVIFVAVPKNWHLESLQKDLAKHLLEKILLKTNQVQRFRPHITIAHRDLEEAIFPKAWDYFSSKNYRRRFKVNSISLFHHKDGKWHVLEEFKLG